MKNDIFITMAVAIIVGAGSFYGGMQYQQNQQPKLVMGAPEEGKMIIRQGGVDQGEGQMQGMKPLSGKITSIDDTSVTIQSPDGSSKIIILSDDTKINKASEGAKADLQEGEQIAAFGTEGSDGSITAQTISIGGGMIRSR